MVAYLTKHAGIADLTAELTKWQTPDYPTATGGQGNIYLGTKPGGSLFAIKCITQADEKYAKHTARELSTWAKLKHPNVLELSGLAMFRGRLAMVSPWMEGGSVKAVLKNNPSMDPYAMCEQLVAVISYLHHRNVIHGDIKGDNLLMGPDGNLKLTDFGLTVMHDKTLQFSETDPAGGTFRWMAPELYLEGAEISKEGDMYAVGMTMLEIITGDIPFREIRSTIAVIKAVSEEKLTPNISELEKKPVSPRAYVMIAAMHRCWRTDPKERATAEEIGNMLKHMGKF